MNQCRKAVVMAGFTGNASEAISDSAPAGERGLCVSAQPSGIFYAAFGW